MTRVVSWNARGNTLLTAQERQQIEHLSNLRGERSIMLGPLAPAPLITISNGVVRVNEEIVGTLAGAPDTLTTETPQ